MHNFNPYLNFMGSTEDAMNFYKSVFGGEFTLFHRYGDVPGGEKMSVQDQEKIIHISLAINKSMTIMSRRPTGYLRDFPREGKSKCR